MPSMADTQHDGPAHFVQLATVGDVATARLLAARLESEGIEVRVHGFSLGPYPMTVGALAETELWVLSDRIDEASTILLDAEVNDALGVVDNEEPRPYVGGFGWKTIAAVLGVAFVGVWLLRVFRILGLY